MTFYESNSNFLKKQYPSLAELFKNEDKNASQIIMTRNNEPNIQISLNKGDYFLHSKYNAREEAMKWVQSIHPEIKEAKHICIFGIGLGYFLEELLEECESKDVFILEPSVDVFDQWIRTRDIKKVLSHPKIRIVAVGADAYLPLQVADEIAGFISGTFKLVVPPIYKKIYPDLLMNFETSLKEMMIKSISNMQTNKMYEKTWVSNILFNLSTIIRSSSLLEMKDVWKNTGTKAIVVGSGPSLKKDVHYLRTLKDKCLIIAAGSSVQALQHFDINPHFVVSMDGSAINNRVFENIDTSISPLVFCPPVYYEIVDQYQCEKYYVGFENDPITKYMMETDELPTVLSTSTVTGTAMQIAEFFGIEEIILMGQDLSYTEDEYYAPGVNHVTEDEKKKKVACTNEWVENVDGGRNKTTESMEVLRQDVELLVQIMKYRGISIINTSKKGAVIQDTTWASMDDLIRNLEQSEPQDFDLSKFIAAPNLPDKISEANRLIVKLQNISNDNNSLCIALKKLIDSINKLQKAHSIRNYNKVNNEILKINEIWNKITETEVFIIFYNYSLAHHINIYMRYVPEIIESHNIFKKAELIISHLGSLINRMKEFSPVLENVIESSIKRLQESK
ncbi:motility associated factor glycosyltransferase family protein [Paenibacillus chibensis]|uniref:motility associated factor glycosyltransferase family protein n=1 Tax=Paenibacillus chibensis TaxID=59846 RepID=UPI000FDAA0C8|nr:6-hydroxymethylpterin diphosphokinase MptE-like protein [Paenibacillus chibensis]MEC0370798.1 DUF115 domain-containing protein [Paenibacillus chibensis]